MIWLVILLFIFILQILTILLKEHKDPNKLTAWLSISFMLPVLSFIIYWLVANDYTYRSQLVHNDGTLRLPITVHSPEKNDQLLQRYRKLYDYIQGLPVYPPLTVSKTEVYNEAKSFYHDLIEDLKQAKDHIHLQFYIFRDDEAGRQIIDILQRKASEGVAVRCIFDGIGSLGYPRQRIQQLRKHGVRVHLFLPPSLSVLRKLINYRNHRKIVVCDGEIGYFGGMNIGIEHLGKDANIGQWRDTQLRVEGDAVGSMQHAFLGDWERVTGEELVQESRFYPMAKWEHGYMHGQKESLEESKFAEPRMKKQPLQRQDPTAAVIQFVPSGPDQKHNAMLGLFYALASAADESIYVTTPYFIPDASITMALTTAAKSGLDVRIIIPGKPDSQIAKLASVSHLEILMQAGVRVYEYQRGFIHAKSIVIDERIATVGTANMDMRSLYSNFELNALIDTPSVVDRLTEDFFRDLHMSKQIRYETFRCRSAWQRTLEAGARMLSPLF